jgi:hypothetical protein
MNSEKDMVVLWLIGLFALTVLTILALPFLFTIGVDAGIDLGSKI